MAHVSKYALDNKRLLLEIVCLYECNNVRTETVARQRFCKYVPATTNKRRIVHCYRTVRSNECACTGSGREV
jgi:hypothetical protein